MNNSYKEIPIEQLNFYSTQIAVFNSAIEEKYLLASIQYFGILLPIHVMEIEKESYYIIDGNRRYLCAEKLNMDKIPCIIHPKTEEGDFLLKQFEIQNNFLSLNAKERETQLSKLH